MVQEKHLITRSIMGGYKLMYALSNEIMTLTMKVKVTKKHEKNYNISETGLDTHMVTIIHR